MASGTLGADVLPKERHKWSEISKVYTRRNPKNNINNNSNSSTVTLAAANHQPDDRIAAETKDRPPVETNDKTSVIETKNGVVEPYEEFTVEKNDGADVEKNNETHVEKNGKAAVVTSNGTVVENDGSGNRDKTPPIETSNRVVVALDDRINVQANDGADVEKNAKAVTSNGTVVENNGGGSRVGDPRTSSENTEEIVIEEEAEGNSPQSRQPVEEANSSQPLQNSPRVETMMLSEDSSSFNRVEAALAPNGHLTNGVVREERPLVSQVDDRLNISVSAAKSKEQVRDLKRKLEDELDQVRKMARKLEAKEFQLNGVSFGVETPDVGRLPEIPVAGRLPEVPLVGRLPEVPLVGRSEEASVIGRMRFLINSGMENNVGMRDNQDFGSVGYNTSRPFRQRSVSLTENNYGVGDFVEKEKRTPKANQFYRNSDFILGKEKLPPAESNRKSKSSGGRKHSAGDFDFAYGIDKKIFKKCGDLLERLRKHKHAWVFNEPVDVKSLNLHDYFDIIKHPMDLGTVKTRLANNWYKTPREFAEDVRLTFHNAMTYNPEWQDVHIMARDMLKIFEDKWPAIEADYDRKLRYEMLRDLGTPTPTSRKTYAPAHAPIHMPPPPLLQLPPFQEARHLDRSQSMPVRREVTVKATRTPAQKKPKAKDPHKREMTFEEKQKLSTNLQNLPLEKLDAIVQIIKKRNSALSQHDDEIEVDIDNVDTETLWELDRFVTNYKKNLSKHKRKAEIAAAQAAAAAAAQAAQPTIPAPVSIEAPRENTADGGNVAPSPHVQQERRSDNESGSSSSSSSSSDSGSSSSDSDSDSSSSSDSDEER